MLEWRPQRLVFVGRRGFAEDGTGVFELSQLQPHSATQDGLVRKEEARFHLRPLLFLAREACFVGAFLLEWRRGVAQHFDRASGFASVLRLWVCHTLLM